jgi:hypothetical protein
MKRLITLVLLLSLAVVYASAQDKSGGRGTIRGVVQDQDGQPVSEVKVRAISRRTDALVSEVTTNHEGKFALLDLPEGRYTLIFYSPRFQQALIESVEVKSGQEKRLDEPVRLKPVKLYAVINGAVFDQNGYLLPGARVVIERIPMQNEEVPTLKLERTANASGEFSFRLPATPARYKLTASAKGFQSQSITVDVGGTERRHVSIQLTPEL